MRLRWPAIAVAAFLSAPGSAAGLPGRTDAANEVRRFLSDIQADAPTRLAPGGIEVVVRGIASVTLPLPGAERLEVELDSDEPLVLVYFSSADPAVELSPPVRYVRLSPGASRLDLDLRTAYRWVPDGRPVLRFQGSALVLLKSFRVKHGSSPPAVAMDHADRIAAWSPEPIWPYTTNFLAPPQVARSPPRWLHEELAWVAAGLFGVLLPVLGWRLGWRRGLYLSLVTAALAGTVAADANLLARFLPAFRLRPTFDPETRIRENYYFTPELGELAALARSAIDPGERVGVLAPSEDWFSAQTVCFNLAPRPCVKLDGGPSVPRYPDISGEPRLGLDELDVVVGYGTNALPPGFRKVLGLGRYRFIARRG